MWGAFLKEYIMVEELKSMVGMDETILYEGKPDKKCFIYESIFNPLLPIAIIWAIFDMGFLGFGMGSIRDVGYYGNANRSTTA